MSAIGPGDWVEALDTDSVPRGTVAMVIAVEVGGCCIDLRCKDTGILSLSIPHHPLMCGWCAAHWRPIYRPKSELIETLLRKADQPIFEDA